MMDSASDTSDTGGDTFVTMPDEGLLGVAIRHSTAEPIRRSYNLANGTVLELQIGGVNGFFWQERYAGILDRLYEEITTRLD